MTPPAREMIMWSAEASAALDDLVTLDEAISPSCPSLAQPPDLSSPMTPADPSSGPFTTPPCTTHDVSPGSAAIDSEQL